MKDSEQTFVLTGLVLFFLLAMHALPRLTVDGVTLRGVNMLSDLLPERGGGQADVIPAPKAPKAIEAKTKSGKKIDFKEQWPKGVEPIVDYSGGEAGGMDHFYEALSHVKTLGRPVRIAYFSDSFVENDIMSADLRELFQSDFGGHGVGWVDLANPINRNSRRTVTQQTSGTREFSVVKKPFDRSRQGIGERYYSVSAGASVTTNLATTFNKYQPHSRQFDVARLFFRAADGATITATVGSAAPQTRTFGASNQVQMFELKGKGSKVNYRFDDADGGFTGFGMALESQRGVILDCMSVRGSSGMTLQDIPQSTLADFARLRPYDLIIVHYGLNVAVKGNPRSTIQHYAKSMEKVVMHLRQAFPEASILVFSVPDHEQRGGDGITTLKEVRELVAFQQQLAADTKVAFCNFFQAMGGEGATRKLVDRDMANKDYTHLSYGGGKYVAGKIYPSFKAGLKNYLRRIKLESE